MRRGFGQKYRVKCTKLSEELICEYGTNNRLFQDPSKERSPKLQKSMVPSVYLWTQHDPAWPVRTRPMYWNFIHQMEKIHRQIITICRFREFLLCNSVIMIRTWTRASNFWTSSLQG